MHRYPIVKQASNAYLNKCIFPRIRFTQFQVKAWRIYSSLALYNFSVYDDTSKTIWPVTRKFFPYVSNINSRSRRSISQQKEKSCLHTLLSMTIHMLVRKHCHSKQLAWFHRLKDLAWGLYSFLLMLVTYIESYISYIKWTDFVFRLKYYKPLIDQHKHKHRSFSS